MTVVQWHHCSSPKENCIVPIPTHLAILRTFYFISHLIVTHDCIAHKLLAPDTHQIYLLWGVCVYIYIYIYYIYIYILFVIPFVLIACLRSRPSTSCLLFAIAISLSLSPVFVSCLRAIAPLPRTTISQDVQTRFSVQLAFAKFLSKIKGNFWGSAVSMILALY